MRGGGRGGVFFLFLGGGGGGPDILGDEFFPRVRFSLPTKKNSEKKQVIRYMGNVQGFS